MVELEKLRKRPQLHRWQWGSWITSTETNVENDNIDKNELGKLWWERQRRKLLSRQCRT